jgi:hypothetical protein
MPAVQCPGAGSTPVPAAAALIDTTLVTDVKEAATPDAAVLPVCLLAVAPAVLLAPEVPLVPEPCFADVWLLLPDGPLVDGLLVVDALEAALPGELAFVVEACVAAGGVAGAGALADDWVLSLADCLLVFAPEAAPDLLLVFGLETCVPLPP